ncbi:hypothetical protein JCM8097_006006 [Rhodosporidiobolus ruineniae]
MSAAISPQQPGHELGMLVAVVIEGAHLAELPGQDLVAAVSLSTDSEREERTRTSRVANGNNIRWDDEFRFPVREAPPGESAFLSIKLLRPAQEGEGEYETVGEGRLSLAGLRDQKKEIDHYLQIHDSSKSSRNLDTKPFSAERPCYGTDPRVELPPPYPLPSNPPCRTFRSMSGAADDDLLLRRKQRTYAIGHQTLLHYPFRATQIRRLCLKHSGPVVHSLNIPQNLSAEGSRRARRRGRPQRKHKRPTSHAFPHPARLSRSTSTLLRSSSPLLPAWTVGRKGHRRASPFSHRRRRCTAMVRP